MSAMQPQTVQDVQDCVRAHRPGASGPLRPVGGRTKGALSSGDGSETLLDLSAFSGIVDYEPQECTFTARAATRVAEVAARLAEHGHYLPFDPPFAPRGATLGGTVAAALSGPARYRYGGVRDFLLGVRFVDGEGRLIRGGGRVVKNAAGFYLQHLLLGSLGRLGVITELTFKVFPAPLAQATVSADYAAFDTLIAHLAVLRRSTFEIESIEILPPTRMLVRLGGAPSALAARVEGLSGFLRERARLVRQLDAAEDLDVWLDARELAWATGARGEAPLVKVATTPGGIARLEPRLSSVNPARRYGVGGEVAWIAWAAPLGDLDGILADLGLAGMVVLGGRPDGPYLGVRSDATFLGRVSRTLDPRGVFGAAAPRLSKGVG